MSFSHHALNFICLVMFLECVPNVALGSNGGIATQSSTRIFGGAAYRAIDGNTSSTFDHGSITHTNKGADPWWKVQLKNTYSISMIVVYNRDDNNEALRARLNNFRMSVMKDEVEVFSYIDIFTPAKVVTTILVQPIVIGDAVKIQLLGDNRILNLAEVEVFGSLYGQVTVIDSPTLHFEFPPVASEEGSNDFLHALCVAGASSAYASSDNPSLTYTSVPAFSSGEDAWDDRTYTFQNVENSVCSSGIYLRPSSVFPSSSIGTKITVTATPENGDEFLLCAILKAADGVTFWDGNWDVQLSALGFVGM